MPPRPQEIDDLIATLVGEGREHFAERASETTCTGLLDEIDGDVAVGWKEDDRGSFSHESVLREVRGIAELAQRGDGLPDALERNRLAQKHERPQSDHVAERVEDAAAGSGKLGCQQGAVSTSSPVLELAEAWGWTTLPDVVVYPAGGGVGIIGIWKAINELRAIGWTDAPMPRLVVVQAAGCAPLVKAWAEGKDVSEFWQGAETVASGLRVPKALGDFLVLQALRESGGTAIAIPDAEIVRFGALLAATEGMWVAPEGAATLAAAAALRRNGWLRDGESVVLINTGSGLKYPAV